MSDSLAVWARWGWSRRHGGNEASDDALRGAPNAWHRHAPEGRDVLTADDDVDQQVLRDAPNERDFIEDVVSRVSTSEIIDDEWQSFFVAKREAGLYSAIAAEDLRADAKREYIETEFENSGTGVLVS